VLTLPWDTLPTDRDPAVYESKWDSYDYPDYATPSGAWTKDWWKNYKDEYTIEMQVEDAIIDAQIGIYEPLVELMAECIYPEDPQLAKRSIRKSMLTDELLEDALRMLKAYDADTVLLTLYDSAYTDM
jgi:hypothetical protein